MELLIPALLRSAQLRPRCACLAAGRSAAPGAVICAALGGAAHLLAGRIEAAGGFAQLLVSLDLLDPPPQPPAEAEQPHSSSSAEAGAAAAAGQAGGQPSSRPWWHEYLPIKRVGSMCTDCWRVCWRSQAWQSHSADSMQPCMGTCAASLPLAGRTPQPPAALPAAFSCR